MAPLSHLKYLQICACQICIIYAIYKAIEIWFPISGHHQWFEFECICVLNLCLNIHLSITKVYFNIVLVGTIQSFVGTETEST